MARRFPSRLVGFGSENWRTIHAGGLEEIVLGIALSVRDQRNNPYHSGIFRHICCADIVHCHQNHAFFPEAAAMLSLLTQKKVIPAIWAGVVGA
jgi:hypothetical protein